MLKSLYMAGYDTQCDSYPIDFSLSRLNQERVLTSENADCKLERYHEVI